jgi:ABC-type long-subunit fatty acid transport system fused permease/ATPase subunit
MLHDYAFCHNHVPFTVTYINSILTLIACLSILWSESGQVFSRYKYVLNGLTCSYNALLCLKLEMDLCITYY